MHKCVLGLDTLPPRDLHLWQVILNCLLNDVVKSPATVWTDRCTYTERPSKSGIWLSGTDSEWTHQQNYYRDVMYTLYTIHFFILLSVKLTC